MSHAMLVLGAVVVAAPLVAIACSNGTPPSNFTGDDGGGSGSTTGSGLASAGGNGSSSTGGGMLGGGSASTGGGMLGGGTGDGSTTAPGTIVATIRDFKFYDSGDPTTDPDFENVPNNIGEDGGPSQGYSGPWDDHAIVTDTLGADNKPVYANASGGTLTTHGATSFQAWYNDVANTNINIPYTLPIVALDDDAGDMAVGYDSNVQGVPYNISGQSGDGFFPIDNQGFGNQGEPHNYSFTMEIHTVFTYKGGETFQFRGDDDVFVYINKKLVINLGGVHGPESASVAIDTLNLTPGTAYPLDFFSAERHVTGSNIKFETTLALRPVVN